MRPPQPLPEPIARRPFSVREAAELGVRPGRLRNPGLVVPTRGARAHQPVDSLEGLAASVAQVVPQPWAFTHVTAGRLLGLPMPALWRSDEPLHVMRPSGGGRVRRPGIVAHRGLESRRVVPVRGLPVTDALTTWADLANLCDRLGLVAIGDAILWRGLSSRLEMAEEIERRPGERGIARLRDAFALVRVGCASPQETRARLFFLEIGLPEPQLNADVISADGRWLGRVDFLWREARVIGEYEGDQHRTDRRQWQHDIARIRDFEDDGWRVVRMTSGDFVRQAARTALAVRLRRLVLGL